MCHPGIIVQILSSRRILSLFCSWTLSLDVLTQDCCCRRCCRCCFSRRPGFTRIVKATVSRCTLEDSSSFQRCSNLVSLTRKYSTVGCEDSQHRLSKFSSFSRNDEPQFIIHDLSEFIHDIPKCSSQPLR